MNPNYFKRSFIPLILLYMSHNCYLCFEITHEDIRSAILSLAHIMRENTEKLERHEFRDRQVDEQLRKALMVISRRIQLIDNFESQFNDVNKKMDKVEQFFIKSTNDITVSHIKLIEKIGNYLNNSSPSRCYDENSTALILEPLQTISEFRKNLTEVWITSAESEKNLKLILLKNLTDIDAKYQLNTNKIKHLIHNSSLDIKTQYEKVENDLKILTNGQTIIINIADHILEIKKKIEYGNHQLSAKMDFFLDFQNEKVDAALTKKFLELNKNIITNYDQLNGNISYKIEIETSQIWRQINIMSTQIMHNSEAISKFNNTSEAFINRTTKIFDILTTKAFLLLRNRLHRQRITTTKK
ncbi:uncharacterized protein [Chelonus insularis]|uniref:uncharacterized protein isoform X2 n=1 Tax=Chelonus insularis TaxID=460826 RepID=UPI001589DF5D|nr:uncharacterized protein LOC118070376 isoform X2 [Chelonus insularis]